MGENNKMDDKLLDFMLEENVLFDIGRDKESLYGKAKSIIGYVYGSSKKDILQKMIVLKKEQDENQKVITKLPTKEEVIASFLEGNMIIEIHKQYSWKDENDFTNLFERKNRRWGELLKEIYFSEFYFQDWGNFSYAIVNSVKQWVSDRKDFSYTYERNEKPIDWSIWGKYADFLKTIDSSFEKDTNIINRNGETKQRR